MTIYDFLPKFIKRLIADRPRQTITHEYWNELFNLLIDQGDHAQEALTDITERLTTDVLYKSNMEEWEPTEEYQPVTKKYVDDNTIHSRNDTTIDGIKTFTTPPIVPAPMEPGQVTNKEYVDSRITSIGLGDANLLDGKPSSYYAKASDVEALGNEIQDINNTIENLSSSAEDITVADVDNKFISNNVEGVLSELFQYANDGKGLIADAITSKGVVASIADSFSSLATKIGQIVTMDEIKDATAGPADILLGKIAYNNNGKITGTIPSKTAAVYIPGTTNQVIAAGQYLSGNQTIAGDPDLVPGNIKEGVNIYGVQGSYKVNRFMQLFTSSGTFTPPESGRYRITAIGKGGDATDHYHGCCGGGGYVEADLVAGQEYSVSIGSSASFAGLITATAGGDSYYGSGTVSGTGVIPFSSNNSSSRSISPPSFYNAYPFLSRGGTGNQNGGDGLFGGDGGTSAISTSTMKSSSSGEVCLMDGLPGGTGAGASGSSRWGSFNSGNGWYSLALRGGGGGGGFGGGGGRGEKHSYYYMWERESYAGHGKGGAACVFIERIA